MTSPLCQAPAIRPEKGVDLVQDLLRALILGLALAQAAGAKTTIMLTKKDCKPSTAPKHRYSYSEDNDDGHYHRLDKSNTVFATFSALKAKKKCTQK
jgi:hypothetical protein